MACNETVEYAFCRSLAVGAAWAAHRGPVLRRHLAIPSARQRVEEIAAVGHPCTPLHAAEHSERCVGVSEGVRRLERVSRR